MNEIVLILGSGPNAPLAGQMPRAALGHVVAINNAWQILPDWNTHIHPEDFPPERRPGALPPGARQITYRDYVPIQNDYGGFVYAGGTMAFTAAYWALGALRPRVMAFLGCDMVYAARGKTHFYGTGTADPLREDITLQSLEAKAARLFIHAARQGCHCVNLSTADSRLVFPRALPADLSAIATTKPRPAKAVAADHREAELAYMVPSGRYWEVRDSFDANALRDLDSLWLKAFQDLA